MAPAPEPTPAVALWGRPTGDEISWESRKNAWSHKKKAKERETAAGKNTWEEDRELRERTGVSGKEEEHGVGSTDHEISKTKLKDPSEPAWWGKNGQQQQGQQQQGQQQQEEEGQQVEVVPPPPEQEQQVVAVPGLLGQKELVPSPAAHMAEAAAAVPAAPATAERAPRGTTRPPHTSPFVSQLLMTLCEGWAELTTRLHLLCASSFMSPAHAHARSTPFTPPTPLNKPAFLPPPPPLASGRDVGGGGGRGNGLLRPPPRTHP